MTIGDSSLGAQKKNPQLNHSTVTYVSDTDTVRILGWDNDDVVKETDDLGAITARSPQNDRG